MDKDYGSVKSRKRKKELGQFFTTSRTAALMSSYFSFKNDKKIKLLDPGAGTGILTAAFVQMVCSAESRPEKIFAVLYENDPAVQDELCLNMQELHDFAEKKHVELAFEIRNEDFLRAEVEDDYDYSIMNPPYKKKSKSEVLGIGLDDVICGQPNLYFLFMEKMARSLKQGGQFSVICPRSWTSGMYFTAFRKSFLSKLCLAHIFVYVSRMDVFAADAVLQETIIVAGSKDKQAESLNIYAGNDLCLDKLWKTRVSSKAVIVDGPERFLLLPTNDEELKAVESASYCTSSISDCGYRLKTGPVVEFRNTEYLQATEDGAAPMILPFHIRNGEVLFPAKSPKKSEYISLKGPRSLFVENQNMIFLKRMTTKEEQKRIQAAIYKKSDMAGYDRISIENHVNYFARVDGKPLSEAECQRLFEFLSSEFCENYYRALNGSTQVNSYEMNHMPVQKGVLSGV